MENINQVKAAKTAAENKILEAIKDFEKKTKHLVPSGSIRLRFEDGKTLVDLNVDIFDQIRPVSNITGPDLKPVKN